MSQLPGVAGVSGQLATDTETPPHSQEGPAWRGPRLDVERLGEVTAALAAGAEGNDRSGFFPAEGIAAVHAAGLLTATVGERYGGPGAGVAQTVAILRALGRGDPSVALITAMTMFLHASQARELTWPSALYAEALAESARRPVLINALRVEPELGTPARGGLPATTARRVPDGWSLTGRKIFSTGAGGPALDDGLGQHRRTRRPGRQLPRPVRRAGDHHRADLGPPGSACQPER